MRIHLSRSEPSLHNVHVSAKHLQSGIRQSSFHYVYVFCVLYMVYMYLAGNISLVKSLK